VSVAVLLLSLGWALSSAAWAINRGPAIIATPDGASPLNAGGSATPFTVLLPRGTHCAHDTEHYGYHVWSYLVPKGTDPTSVHFVGLVPTPGFGFVGGGQLLAGVNTEANTGRILLPATLSFALWSATDLLRPQATTATLEGGLACIDSQSRMSAYWNVEFRFTANPSDPQGVTWVVTKPLTRIPVARSPRPWGKMLAAVGAVAVAAGLARALWPSRRRSRLRATGVIPEERDGS
jgi:hypothetical protein